MNKPITRKARRFTQFTQKEIQDLFNRTQVVVRESGIEIRRASKKGAFSQFLIIIPRTVGKAVMRNKLRRRIKAIIHTHKLYDSNFDGIILARKPAEELTYQELEAIMLKVFA